MKRKHLKFSKGFRVALIGAGAEAAEMVIAPGDAEGGPDNRHRGADQWLFVIAGQGCATVNGRKYPLRAGNLVLIEKKDRHEVRNTGRGLLRTLNFYVPPAYSKTGKELSRGKP